MFPPLPGNKQRSFHEPFENNASERASVMLASQVVQQFGVLFGPISRSLFKALTGIVDHGQAIAHEIKKPHLASAVFERVDGREEGVH